MKRYDDGTGKNRRPLSTRIMIGEDKNRNLNDFYASPPNIIDYLLKYENFDENVWECACGNGNLSKRLEEYGYNVLSTDLIYRGYGKGGVDFLKCTGSFDGDIITNPPFNLVNQFVSKALELSKQKVALFCKVQLLETVSRYEKIHKIHPFARMYVFVRRVRCYKMGVCGKDYHSAICYCWFIWDKKYEGEPIVRWIFNENQ